MKASDLVSARVKKIIAELQNSTSNSDQSSKISQSKIIKRLQRQLMVLLFYSLLSVALLAPSANSVTVLPDLFDSKLHVSLIVQARQALEEGQFPIRVAPWQSNGWRLPEYQYYGQFPDTISGLVYKFFTPDNPYIAYLIVVWLAVTTGGFFIYKTARRLTRSGPAAFLAGASYMAAPYWLVNIHGRAAFTETVAQGVVPVVLYYSLRCYAGSSSWVILPGGLAWFCLMTTHTITFIYFSVFLGLVLGLANLRAFKSRKTLAGILRVGSAFGIGILLAFYYLGPVVFESRHLKINYYVADPYLSRTFTPLSGLLSPAAVTPFPGYNLNQHPDFTRPAVGWTLLSAWLIMLYYYFNPKKVAKWPSSLKSTRRYILPLLLAFAVSFFIVWSPFDFWLFIPRVFWVTQFTYRILTQIMWTGALLVAYSAVLLFRPLQTRHIVAGLLGIGLLSSSYLPSLEPSSTTINTLVAAPDIGYGQNDYLYDPDWTEIYGNQQPGLYGVAGKLLLDEPITFPRWAQGEQPILWLQARVEGIDSNSTLIAWVDDQKLDELSLKNGEFEWKIPLNKAIVTSTNFQLKFTTQPAKTDKIYVVSAYFQNFSKTRTLLDVKTVEKNFRQNGPVKSGTITIDETERSIELPSLYYPEMLDIRVDGKPAKYFPIPHDYYTLTGLKLPPGTHQIEISFVGLSWANLISAVAWLALLLALLAAGLHRIFFKRLNFKAKPL